MYCRDRPEWISPGWQESKGPGNEPECSNSLFPYSSFSYFALYCIPMTTDPSLFLKNLWYMAFHSSFLRKGKLVAKEILGERIVFGRDSNGEAFALRDNCAHRGVPLSEGWFEGHTLQYCYHGW